MIAFWEFSEEKKLSRGSSYFLNKNNLYVASLLYQKVRVCCLKAREVPKSFRLIFSWKNKVAQPVRTGNVTFTLVKTFFPGYFQLSGNFQNTSTFGCNTRTVRVFFCGVFKNFTRKKNARTHEIHL